VSSRRLMILVDDVLEGGVSGEVVGRFSSSVAICSGEVTTSGTDVVASILGSALARGIGSNCVRSAATFVRAGLLVEY
jgi:hypothetical protein